MPMVLIYSIFFFGINKLLSGRPQVMDIESKILLNLSHNKTNLECLQDL